MVNLPCASPDAADGLPGLVVQIGVEPRQHHRALLQAGYGGENFAVAGIEPVEPAAMTRPFMMRGQARGFGFDQAVAPFRGLDPADFFRCSGHVLRAMRKNSSECCQYLSNWSGTSLSSASHATPRVTMSSISRARSPASASVDAGPPTTSGRRNRTFRPRRDQVRQRQAALEFA